MNTLQRIGIGAAALLLAIGLLAPRSAEASHFRGMYVYVSDVLSGNEVEITVVQFWRYGAFGSDFDVIDGNEPEVGDVIDPTTTPLFGGWLADDGAVDLGDGTTYGDESSETWTLTGLDSSEDWAVIQTTFTHTYPSSGEFTVGLSGFARIDGLENGWNGDDYVVESDIRTDNVSATTSSGPFVGVPQGANVTYQVPFTNPDNDQLRFKLADPSEAGVSGTNPPGLSINQQTGEITWDNSNLLQGSLHALQVTIEEYDQGVDPANNPKATVASDFIFKVAAQGNEQPVCDLNPSSTTVSPGDQVSIDVTGSDAEGDADDDPDNTVRISSTSLPGGTLSPNPQVGTSPQTATFNWTPGNTGTFNAQFSVGDGLTTTLCTATIDVETQQTCDVPTLSQDDIDQDNRTLSNTMQDDEGVAEFTFTTLDNFTVVDNFDSGYDASDSDGDTKLDTWTWNGSGGPPTSVDFTLEAGPDNTSTYFLEVTDACDDPGPNTVTFDPAYEFGPAASRTQLAGNAPNPFSGQTTIEFDLAERSRVTVAVYDMMGRKVATLVDGVRSSGPHAVGWNGQSDSGQDLASGVYLLRMRAEGKSETKRMTIIR